MIRTAFIVGFPGETDEAFERLCEFVEQARFDHVAVFTYSDEQGTAAAQLEGKVPAEVAKWRRDRLMAIQEPIAEQRLERFVASEQSVLVCGVDERGQWYGRTEGQAPEVDGVDRTGDFRWGFAARVGAARGCWQGGDEKERVDKAK